MMLYHFVGALAIFVSQGICVWAQDNCNMTADPRPELGNMNRASAGYLNMLTNFAFASDSVVRGLEFYSERISSGFLSFWRETNVALNYQMVGKIEVTSDGSGFQSLLLSKEDQIFVKQGDVIAAHYSSFSDGVFPYEEKTWPNENADILPSDLFQVITAPIRDDRWTPGQPLNLSSRSFEQTLRTIPVKVLADCVTCFHDGASKQDNCDETDCPETTYESITVFATNAEFIEYVCLDEQKNLLRSGSTTPIAGRVLHTLTFPPSTICAFMEFKVRWQAGAEPDFNVTDVQGCSVNECDQVWCDMNNQLPKRL